MKKRLKAIERQLDDCGLVLLDMEQKRGGHLRLHIKNQYGKTMLYFASVSPSDRRTRLQQRGDFRRFARKRN